MFVCCCALLSEYDTLLYLRSHAHAAPDSRSVFSHWECRCWRRQLRRRRRQQQQQRQHSIVVEHIIRALKSFTCSSVRCAADATTVTAMLMSFDMHKLMEVMKLMMMMMTALMMWMMKMTASVPFLSLIFSFYKRMHGSIVVLSTRIECVLGCATFVRTQVTRNVGETFVCVVLGK